MITKIISPLILLIIFLNVQNVFAQNKVLFDLSHGQFQDVFVDPSYYDYVLPEYEKIAKENNFDLLINKSEITDAILKDINTLLIISPLAKSTQKNFTEAEKIAIIDFIKNGGSAIIFVDEEEYRVNLNDYGANDITKPFGIEIHGDVKLPGNCGAVTFINEIFAGRREVPCSGARSITGGIPASVSYDEGYQLSSYVKLNNGGKLYVAGETMVALLMGYPDGERNVHKMMQTRWWGKNSRLYMTELLNWSLIKSPFK